MICESKGHIGKKPKKGLHYGENFIIIKPLGQTAHRAAPDKADRANRLRIPGRGGFEMVKAIVGANWGDEGKGKITDLLAESSDVVVRFQGGANAGHTIINDYGRFALHILPSGIFYPHITNIIGNGVALDAVKLVNELKGITDQGVPAPT